jgi:hypothetical protein
MNRVGAGLQFDPPLGRQFVEGLVDDSGELVGGLVAQGLVVAKETGDGAGSLEGEGSELGVVEGAESGIGTRGGEVGQDAAKGDAGTGDLGFEGVDAGIGQDLRDQVKIPCISG